MAKASRACAGLAMSSAEVRDQAGGGSFGSEVALRPTARPIPRRGSGEQTGGATPTSPDKPPDVVMRAGGDLLEV